MMELERHVTHGEVFWRPMVEFCDVCARPHGHPEMPREMGMYGVNGHWYCSEDCHNQVECRRVAVVFTFVHHGMGEDGEWQAVACHGPQSNPDFRCPECDYRSSHG